MTFRLHAGLEKAEGVEQLSMGNIQTGSSLVWAHWVGMWLFSCMVMYQLDVLYRKVPLALPAYSLVS
jgi:hypothetical protein